MHRRVLCTIACASLLVAVGAIGAAPVAADAPTTAATPTAAQLATLSQSEISLLHSGQPINVVMDPTTGDIVSVTAGSGTALETH